MKDRPAFRVIEKCGGIEATAALVNRHRSVVNKWLLPRENGGTDGFVPTKHQQTLVNSGKVVPADFFDAPEQLAAVGE